jgi:hypothetical protein
LLKKTKTKTKQKQNKNKTKQNKQTKNKKQYKSEYPSLAARLKNRYKRTHKTHI